MVTEINEGIFNVGKFVSVYASGITIRFKKKVNLSPQFIAKLLSERLRMLPTTNNKIQH